MLDKYSLIISGSKLNPFGYTLELSTPFEFRPIKYPVFDVNDLPNLTFKILTTNVSKIIVYCDSYFKSLVNKNQTWYTRTLPRTPTSHPYAIFKSEADSLAAHMCNMGFPLVEEFPSTQESACPYR